MPPKSFHHATRTALNSRSSGARKRSASVVRESGLCGFGPAIALRNSATSATDRAIGPETDRGDQEVDALATHPGDVRKPTTLQNAAGLRREPPVSLPSAIGSIRQASVTAAPPLLPPQVFVRSYGFRVGPNTSLKVCDPAPSSGVLVLPHVIAPAARIRCTISASSAGTKSL